MGKGTLRRNHIHILPPKSAWTNLYRDKRHSSSIRAVEELAIRLLEQHVSRWTEEHVELLSPNQVPKDIEINSWVRIRSGLYRKDIGQVVAMNYNAEFYSVLVVPRIPPPVPARKLTKQARSQKDRPQPQRLRKKDAIRKYGKGTVKKLEGDEFEEDDFQFKKNRYKQTRTPLPSIPLRRHRSR